MLRRSWEVAIIPQRVLKKTREKLGICFYNGYSVTQDYAKAVYWFAKAAEQGLAAAQDDLGTCYYRGDGAAQDYAKAFYWFTKAVEQGLRTYKKKK